MVPSAPRHGLSDDPAAGRILRDHFNARRAGVDGFVARHFTWPGTLRLHGAAFGGDILRAPINVLLSPLLVLTRLVAWICRRAGLRRVADWLVQRRILLRTSVARRVEGLIVTDLLGLPLAADAAPRSAHALTRAVLAAPQLREMIRKQATPADAEALGQRIAAALGDYAGTRSAVADITTSICVLITGALVFQALTPGLVSMAPGVANAVAHQDAVAGFLLGETIGGVWYGVFGTSASPGLLAATIAALLLAGSVVAAFAGVLADPVQARLGIHRRRLLRLIDTLEAQIMGQTDKPFAAREHLYARFLDIWDATASALRAFRN